MGKKEKKKAKKGKFQLKNSPNAINFTTLKI